LENALRNQRLEEEIQQSRLRRSRVEAEIVAEDALRRSRIEEELTLHRVAS